MEERVPEKSSEVKKNINIKFNSDKTEAYITITYQDEGEDLSNKNLPELISEDEIIQYLNSYGIKYGILQSSIEYIKSNKEVKELLIAKGEKARPPIEDKLNILFGTNKKIEIDENIYKIDYKNINNIISVKENEVLAEIIIGEDGVNGVNVFSEVIPSRPKKIVEYKAGQGCKLVDNKFISTMAGKPNYNKSSVWVEPMYVLNNDVNLKSGNINFPANVKINGKITDGMKVNCGNSLFVSNGAFNAVIKANNSSKIEGNIIGSTIEIGGIDLIRQERIDLLNELKDKIESILANFEYLKNNNLIKADVSEKMMIRLLIETKYKDISKLSVKIISNFSRDYNKSDIVKIVRNKLLGTSIANINSIKELEELLEKVNDELNELNEEAKISIDLIMDYGQESEIKAAGDIVITGKGLFTSRLYAKDNIKFTSKNAVCRGGHLKAGKGIYATIVGNESGVVTQLEVEKKGEIKVDIAYQNTIFIVANRKHILDKASKNIHVYLDKDGSIVINKLLL